MSLPPLPWHPLLQGHEAARARAAAVAIANDLAETPESSHSSSSEYLRLSVLAGDAGKALYYAYLEQCCPDRGFGQKGCEHMELAVEALSQTAMVPDLYCGFTGVAWAAEQLQESVVEPPEDEDPNAEVDDALRHFLARSPWQGPYDLISGLVGFAVYALRRLPRRTAVECLELVVERFAELAVERGDGVTWYTNADELVNESREFFKDGYENLGVAHGVPGVIAVLARTCAAGVASGTARPLLDGAVRWLLAQKLEGCDSVFPTAVAPGVDVKYSRAAWCYGDPGVAATLLVAARAVGEPDWETEALSLARHSARRPEETTGVRDACLCHGAAGLAHLFNRMYQATGDEVLAAAARAWYTRVLEMRQPGQGCGGYLGWGVVGEGERAWSADSTFLSGAIGIGLAMLAGAGDVDPWWDELLLASPLPCDTRLPSPDPP